MGAVVKSDVLNYLNVVSVFLSPLLLTVLSRMLKTRDAIQDQIRRNTEEQKSRIRQIEETIFRHDFYLQVVAQQLKINIPTSTKENTTDGI